MAKILFDPLLNDLKFADTLTDQQDIIDNLTDGMQGYYALLSNFYFTGGLATSTEITTEQVDTWLDIELAIDPLGTFDYRTTDMKSAQTVGHLGTGANGDPICFKLEGLTQTATANLRAVFSYDPDEDGTRLETRLLFTRHSGTTPSTDFSIEGSSLVMESGADIEYAASPSAQFFVGDTIDTNAPGDAGKVQFQIKVDGAGTILMKELGLFIQA
jgi:hypothetical protein